MFDNSDLFSSDQHKSSQNPWLFGYAKSASWAGHEYQQIVISSDSVWISLFISVEVYTADNGRTGTMTERKVPSEKYQGRQW